MAKIAIAGGHSKAAPGASGYLDEYECDRAYVKKLIEGLEAAGHEVIDCTNEKATVNAELEEEVRLANASQADCFLAVHFNAGGGTGTECWYYTGNDEGYSLARAMSRNVADALGLRDRGPKASTALYVIRNTDMPAVLLETCFVDSRKDADAWNGTSWKLLVGAVVSAFGGNSVEIETPAEAAKPAQERAAASKASLDADGYWGPATVKAVQKALGTTIDGVVSGQDSRDMSAIGGRPSDAWKVGKGGSQMVRALQGKLGVSADGYFGPNTLKALQKAMGTTVDGVLSKPSACVREMQRRLNSGSF